MSKYYVPPVVPSSENPIADAIGGVGASIAQGLMARRRMQAERENDAIVAARAAERDQLRMQEGGWQSGAAPDLIGHRQIEALPEIQQSPFLEEPPEDPVSAALRSYGPAAPQLPNPSMMMPTFDPNPDYMQAQVGGKDFHKQTPAAAQKAEDKKREQETLQKRQRELAVKAREVGLPVPDWSSADVDEVEMQLADARFRDGMSKRATATGHRAPNPGEDMNSFRASVEAAETRNAQSIQTNRVADDARMHRQEEVDTRIGKLASVLVGRGVNDPQQAARIVSQALTSRDRQLGISPIDVVQRARIGASGGGRDADPKAEARKVWEKISAPVKIGSSGASRTPSPAKVLSEWDKMKPELAVIHGEAFVSQMDALIRQLAAARGTEQPNR